MAADLSTGSIIAMMRGEVVETPTLQVLGVRKLSNPNTDDRYRVMLSDGDHFINFGMLATQLNHQVESGELDENAIVKLTQHVISVLNRGKSNERKVLIVLGIEVLIPGTSMEKIGNPDMCTETTVVEQRNGSAATENGPGTSNGTNGTMERPAKMPRMDNYNNTGRQNIDQSNIMTRPISSINPYQNKWVIRARVTAKTTIRTWSNSRGEGKLFSMDLKDESGEIRATAFKDECDKFYNMIDINKVYYFSNCTVKAANKKFSQIKNDFELTFGRDTTVNLVEDNVESVPGLEYNFQPIASLADAAVDTFVDIIGVCKSAGEVSTLISRSSGKELKKREINIVDNSNASVSLTLWGERAEEFDGHDNPVVVLHQVKVGEYQGSKNLSLGMSTSVLSNPDMPEAHRLKGWYENGGDQQVTINVSAGQGAGGSSQGFGNDFISLSEAKEKRLGFGETADYYCSVASLMSFRRENVYYLGCPAPDCKKKVLDNHNGTFRCEKCQKDYDDCLPRMIINMNVADWSDNQWVTLFDGDAQLLFGIDGKELRRRKEESEEEFNATFDKMKFIQMKLKLRAKAEMYNDESRLKTSVIKYEPLDVKEHSKLLLKEIQNMMAAGIKSEPGL